MNISETQVSRPWQPVTAGGVAAFAFGEWWRLLATIAAVAGLSLAVVLWVVTRVYVPALESAMKQLPDQGYLMDGKLEWRGEPVTVLHRNNFIAIIVNLEARRARDQTADVLVEITPRSLSFYSLFGELEVPYPSHWVVAANRPGLQSWWGAWRLPILSLLSVGFLAGLSLSWLLLATLYCLPVWGLAWFGERRLTLGGSWKLSLAALMPGALLLTGGIFLYGTHQLNLAGLLIVVPLHLLIGWLYLFLAVRKLPSHSAFGAAAGTNPFGSDPEEDSNPFGEK